MSLGRRRLAMAVAALASTGAVSALGETTAAGSESKAAVVVAEGPDADALSGGVAARLPSSFVVRSARDFRAAAALGGGAPIASGLKSRHADGELLAHACAAVKEMHLDLAVVLHARKSRRATVVHVWLVTPSSCSGAAVDEDVNVGAAASTGDEVDGVWNAIKDAFPSDSPAPPPAPAPAPATASSPVPAPVPESAPTPGADEPAQSTSADAPSLLRVAAAMAAGSRHFAYVDRLTSSLRPYDLFAAPIASLAVDVLPFARSASALLQGLGLDAGYAHSFGVSSADAAGTSVSTNWQELHADVRELVPIGDVVQAGAHAGFGMIDFTFDGALGGGAELPSVGYRFVRPGIDGRVSLRDFTVFAEASYLAVLSTGGLGSMFPRGSAAGVDASVGLAWPIARHLDLSFELAYTRFFYSLDPQPGDANVAGGALDEMARASLALGYRL